MTCWHRNMSLFRLLMIVGFVIIVCHTRHHLLPVWTIQRLHWQNLHLISVYPISIQAILYYLHHLHQLIFQDQFHVFILTLVVSLKGWWICHDSLLGCDHDALSCNISVLPPKQTSAHCYPYNCKKANFDEFKGSLYSIPWNLAVSEDINTWWESWKDFLWLLCLFMFLWWGSIDKKCRLSPHTIKLIKSI